MSHSSTNPHDSIPVLLLKTKSSPGDAYEDILSTPHSHGDTSIRFTPRFVPVLQHRFEDAGMDKVASLLRGREIGAHEGAAYGGLIFTSQRAVEAFTKLVVDGTGDLQWPHLQEIPVYSVGPATTRALSAVPQTPALHIEGSHTGNGEALAAFILEHYYEWYCSRRETGAQGQLPPLLFLVGEQRRDIIPKALTDPSLPPDRRISVTEEIVYGTGVMESFPTDFAAALKELPSWGSRGSRWVVVFSPTGCDNMLRGLDWLDAAGKFDMAKRERGSLSHTRIVTIGPTTRSHLVESFGFKPDASAKTPTPQGVVKAILEFEKAHGLKEV